jgi:hypothetical protein
MNEERIGKFLRTYVETPTPVPRKPVNSGKSDPNLERPLPGIPTSPDKIIPTSKSRGPLPPVPNTKTMYRQRSYENTKLQKCTDAPVVQDDKNTDAQEGDSDDQEDYTELEAYGKKKKRQHNDKRKSTKGQTTIYKTYISN